MTELEEVLSPEAAEKAHELFGRMDRRLSMQVTVPTLRRDAHHGPPAGLQMHPTSTAMAKPTANRLSRPPTTRLLAPARPVPTRSFKPCTHATHACTQARCAFAPSRRLYVHDVLNFNICAMLPFIRTPVRLRSLREMREGPLGCPSSTRSSLLPSSPFPNRLTLLRIIQTSTSKVLRACPRQSASDVVGFTQRATALQVLIGSPVSIHQAGTRSPLYK